MDNNWRPDGTALRNWMWLVTEWGLGCTCSACVDWWPSVAVDDSQVTNLLSWAHTCKWERKDLLLSCHGFWLFSNRLLGVGIRWRSKHHTDTGSRCWGLESKFGRDLDPLTEVEWFSLVCAWGTSEAYVSGYPARIHWFVNRRFYETVWLGNGLAP